MWQGGNNDSRCLLPPNVSHLHHLDTLPAGTQQLWQQRFNPSSVEASVQAITAANWELLRDHTPYRSMHVPGAESAWTDNGLLGLLCAALFSAACNGRHVYHNTPAWQWKPTMQLVTAGAVAETAL
jgi:hypothetical protein